MKHTGKISFNSLTEKTNKNVSPMQKRSEEMEIYRFSNICCNELNDTNKLFNAPQGHKS